MLPYRQVKNKIKEKIKKLYVYNTNISYRMRMYRTNVFEFAGAQSAENTGPQELRKF